MKSAVKFIIFSFCSLLVALPAFSGWVLLPNPADNSFIHCQVSNLLENNRIIVFCDIKGVGRGWAESFADNFLGEIPAVKGFAKGSIVTLKEDFEDYKKGERVRIRALFKNGMALILNDPFKHTFLKGRYQDSISKVISTDLLNP